MMFFLKEVAHSLAIEVVTENLDLNRDREDKMPRLQHVTWDAPHQPCWKEKDAWGWGQGKASLSFPSPPCSQIQETSTWLFFSS